MNGFGGGSTSRYAPFHIVSYRTLTCRSRSCSRSTIRITTHTPLPKLQVIALCTLRAKVTTTLHAYNPRRTRFSFTHHTHIIIQRRGKWMSGRGQALGRWVFENGFVEF